MSNDHPPSFVDGQAPDWREGLRRSRLFAPLVTPHWLTDPRCQAQAAYARALGKPFRVLVLGDLRLPEDAFAGISDLQVVRVTTPEEASAHLAHWIREAHDG